MEQASIPVTGNTNLDHWLAILGAFVPLASALTSLINHRVRTSLDAGQTPAKGLLTVGSILNFASVNVDKGLQMMRMLKEAAPVVQNPATTVVDPTTVPTQPALCPTCGRPA